MTKHEYHTKPTTIKAILFDGSFDSVIDVLQFLRVNDKFAMSVKIQEESSTGKRVSSVFTIQLGKVDEHGIHKATISKNHYVVIEEYGGALYAELNKSFEKTYTSENRIKELEQENEELKDELLER